MAEATKAGGKRKTKRDRRTYKRRKSDLAPADMKANPALATKGMLQKILWERAKGELNALIACCESDPTTEHCQAIAVRARDAETVLDSLMYHYDATKVKEV